MSDDNDKLLKFPCVFPIKVFGKSSPDFSLTIGKVVQSIVPSFDLNSIVANASSGKNYTALTVTITAQSQEELDRLYKALSSHPLVKMVI